MVYEDIYILEHGSIEATPSRVAYAISLIFRVRPAPVPMSNNPFKKAIFFFHRYVSENTCYFFIFFHVTVLLATARWLAESVEGEDTETQLFWLLGTRALIFDAKLREI